MHHHIWVICSFGSERSSSCLLSGQLRTQHNKKRRVYMGYFSFDWCYLVAIFHHDLASRWFASVPIKFWQTSQRLLTEVISMHVLIVIDSCCSMNIHSRSIEFLEVIAEKSSSDRSSRYRMMKIFVSFHSDCLMSSGRWLFLISCIMSFLSLLRHLTLLCSWCRWTYDLSLSRSWARCNFFESASECCSVATWCPPSRLLFECARLWYRYLLFSMIYSDIFTAILRLRGVLTKFRRFYCRVWLITHLTCFDWLLSHHALTWIAKSLYHIAFSILSGADCLTFWFAWWFRRCKDIGNRAWLIGFDYCWRDACVGLRCD